MKNNLPEQGWYVKNDGSRKFTDTGMNSRLWTGAQVCELIDELLPFSDHCVYNTLSGIDDVYVKRFKREKGLIQEVKNCEPVKTGQTTTKLGYGEEVKPSLELGKVYTNHEYPTEMFFISSFEDCNSYGFDANGRWMDKQQFSETDVNWREAPILDWFEALRLEAKKRGHIYNRYQWHDQTSCFMGTMLHLPSNSNLDGWFTLLNVKGIWLEADEIELNNKDKSLQDWAIRITDHWHDAEGTKAKVDEMYTYFLKNCKQ